jgi:light-regulated signal transduction histidine kinase (bacteriophytochrome)
MVSNLFAAQMFSLAESRRRERLQLRDELLSQISRMILPGQRVEDAFSSFLGIAARALEAHGIVLSVGGRLQKSGHTPSDTELEAILAHLTTQSAPAVYHASDLSKAIPGLSHGGGMLATPLSSLNHDFILWFRDPVQRLIRWAGKPEQNITPIGSAGYRLSPRDSFEAWLEVVNGDSPPLG